MVRATLAALGVHSTAVVAAPAALGVHSIAVVAAPAAVGVHSRVVLAAPAALGVRAPVVLLLSLLLLHLARLVLGGRGAVANPPFRDAFHGLRTLPFARRL